MNKSKDKIAILIPAHNEARIISSTLETLLQLIPKEDIYLVDDHSSDMTVSIAQEYIDNILPLNTNCSKAQALNFGIRSFQLKERYDYIFPLDADTKLEPDFISRALSIFKKDKNNQITAVVGKITGSMESWITAFRLWEYEISQTIHKRAQGKIDAVLVCSGCATIYRSSLFDKIAFSRETLTEDMDMTFKIHRLRLGKVVFCEKAVAQTQDPLTLSDFIKQIERWFTGYWQCIYKHKIPFGGQSLDFEVALNSIEGILGGFVVLGLIFSFPWLVYYNPFLLLTALLVDLLLFSLPTIIIISLRYRTFNLIKYLVHFYFLRVLISLIFLKAYFKTILGFDFGIWHKASRYSFS